MSTNRPATFAPNNESEASPRPVKDLTFIFGPPTDEDACELISKTAAEVNVTPDELWIEMVRGSVAELIEPGADRPSILDEMISYALDERVTVRDVQGALHFQCGRQFPGLIIESSRIVDAHGRPVDRDLADHEIRNRMAAALVQYTHADWATCIATYEHSEPGYPSFAAATGEQS